MSITVPTPAAAYLEADARRDTNAVVALFTEDAVVVDEGETHHGAVGHPGLAEWRGGEVQVHHRAVRFDQLTDQEFLGRRDVDG